AIRNVLGEPGRVRVTKSMRLGVGMRGGPETRKGPEVVPPGPLDSRMTQGYSAAARTKGFAGRTSFTASWNAAKRAFRGSAACLAASIQRSLILVACAI